MSYSEIEKKQKMAQEIVIVPRSFKLLEELEGRFFGLSMLFQRVKGENV
jgi:hypothetical protein